MKLGIEEFANRGKEITGVPKYQCKEALEICLLIFEDILETGDTLSIKGCFDLKCQIKKPITTRDLRTGERVTYPSKILPLLKWGARMKRAAMENAEKKRAMNQDLENEPQDNDSEDD